MSYKKAKLSIDSMNGTITIDGWAEDTERWNGWSYVLMDIDNAMKLAYKLDDVIEYHDSEDAFVEVFHENEHESKDDLVHWDGFEEDKLGHLYAIGSGYWCWTHEFPSEFDNMHHALREFLQKADELVKNWDNEYPTIYRKYPNYLPSFDEFVEDMRVMLLQEEDIKLREWRKTIQ